MTSLNAIDIQMLCYYKHKVRDTISRGGQVRRKLRRGAGGAL